MQMTGRDTLQDYYPYLRENAEEGQALFSDFLISVTMFFRDAATFELLQLKILPALREDEVVRQALAVIQEVVLDDIRAISEAEHEVAMSVVGVVLHDVPQYRAIPDVDHGLGDAV